MIIITVMGRRIAKTVMFTLASPRYSVDDHSNYIEIVSARSPIAAKLAPWLKNHGGRTIGRAAAGLPAYSGMAVVLPPECATISGLAFSARRG